MEMKEKIMVEIIKEKMMEKEMEEMKMEVEKVAKKIAAAKEEMDPIDVIGSTELVQDQLEAAMKDEMDTVDIEKTYTTPEKSSGDETSKKELDHDGGQRI